MTYNKSMINYIKELKVAKGYLKANSGLVDKYALAMVYKKILSKQPQSLNYKYKLNGKSLDSYLAKYCDIDEHSSLYFGTLGKDKVPTLHLIMWSNTTQMPFTTKRMIHMPAKRLIKYIKHPYKRVTFHSTLIILFLFGLFAGISLASTLGFLGVILSIISVICIFCEALSLVGTFIQHDDTTLNIRNFGSPDLYNIVVNTLNNIYNNVPNMSISRPELEDIKENRKQIKKQHTTWHDFVRKVNQESKSKITQ